MYLTFELKLPQEETISAVKSALGASMKGARTPNVHDAFPR
jgi:hypothetical protein